MIFNKKKILFIGNLIISKYILETLIKNKRIKVCGVITTKNKFNFDYFNLTNIAKKNKIPLHSGLKTTRKIINGLKKLIQIGSL